MKVIGVGGVILLVTGQVIHSGGFHLDVPGYHGEPRPSNQFDLISTVTGTTASLGDIIRAFPHIPT
jgi:hypothetical protein